MMPEKTIAELSELYLHDDISAEELRLLNRILQEDPDVRKVFLELTKLECAFYEHFCGTAPIILKNPADHFASDANQRGGMWNRVA